MLDQKTLAELKQKLLAEKERIEKNMAPTEKGEKGVDREYQTTFPDLDRDQEENADEMEMYESALATDETLKRELKKINAALVAMDNSTYGRCKNCGKEIPLDRLMAYPQADTCLKCSPR